MAASLATSLESLTDQNNLLFLTSSSHLRLQAKNGIAQEKKPHPAEAENPFGIFAGSNNDNVQPKMQDPVVSQKAPSWMTLKRRPVPCRSPW